MREVENQESQMCFASSSNLRTHLSLLELVDLAVGLPISRIVADTNRQTTGIFWEDRKYLALFFEGQKTELKDLDFRKAANWVIYTGALTKTVMLGKGDPSSCTLLTILSSKLGKASFAKQDVVADKPWLQSRRAPPSHLVTHQPCRLMKM